MTEETSPPKKNAREIVAERKANQQNPLSEKPNKPNWSLRILLIVFVFLLGSAATIYALPVLKERLPILGNWVGNTPAAEAGPLLANRISALEIRLNQQHTDIQKLKTTKQNTPATDPLLLERLGALEQKAARQDNMSQSARIDMLLNRMSQLEASFVPLSKGLSDAQQAKIERSQLAETATVQTKQMNDIEHRLNKVEAYAARDNSGALIAFRIGELRRKVTSGENFGPEIDALQAMIAEGSFALDKQITEALEWLNQHRGGIVTGGGLRDQFNDLIPTLIRTQSAHEDDPWWKRAYYSTKNLIMVRKTDLTASENLDNIIANAHKMLSRFELDKALVLLKQLPDNIKSRLDVWAMQAEIYLQADNQLGRIETITTNYFLDSEKEAETEL